MIKLSAYDSLLLLSTKGMRHKDYNGETFDWSKDVQESILTGYDSFVFSFMKRGGLNQENVSLENINLVLLDIFKQVCPNSVWQMLEAMQGYRYVESTGFGKKPFKATHSPAQALFVELYGRLQAVQVKKADKETGELIDIISFNETLVN